MPSTATILKNDLLLAKKGIPQEAPQRKLLLRAVPALLAITAAFQIINIQNLEETAKEKPAAPVSIQTPASQRSLGKVLLIGQHHFEVEETNKALPALKKAGADVFAIELPSDYNKAIQKYLKSARTENDKIQLSSHTMLRTELHPEWIEKKREMREKILASMGSDEKVQTTTMIDLALQSFYKSPNQWVGSAKVTLDMLEKAHDAGLEVVCIDMDSIRNIKMNPSMGSEAVFLQRNQEMVKNLSALSQKGKNVVGAVGAGHTGSGNKTSVNELARRIGIPCVAIDTYLANEKTEISHFNNSQYLGASDKFAMNAKQILDAFKSLVGKTKDIGGLGIGISQ